MTYLTKEEYLNKFNMPVIQGEEVSDKDYSLALSVASEEINWLSGFSIGEDLTLINQPYTTLTGTTYDAQKRIEIIKGATALMAKNLADRGIEWLRGSASLTIGGNFSTSQTNPDEPDYLPPVILRKLEQVGFFTRQDFRNLDDTGVFSNKTRNPFLLNPNGQNDFPVGAGYVQAIVQEFVKVEIGKLPPIPKSQFNEIDDNGKIVYQPKGKDIQMKDDSGNPIVPTSPSSVATIRYVDEADANIQLNINDVQGVADEALIKTNSNEAKITAIDGKVNSISGGVKIYHYGTKADADTAKATINFNEGDLAWIGTTGDWIGYHFISGNWVLNGTTSTHTPVVDAYTKSEADSKFEAKSFDYSNVDNIFTKITLDLGPNKPAGRGQNIAKPATENAPTGAKIKLKLKDGNTNPADLPIDEDGFYYNGKPVWILKGSDIANYSEIKANITAGKIMVGIKQEDGSIVLSPWEDAPFNFKDAWDNEVVIPKGEVKFFNEVKSGTKFEDTSLFTKSIFTDGQAILGGTDGSTTNGSVGELPINKNITLTSFGGTNSRYSPLNLDLTTTGDGNQGCISGDSGSYIRQKFSSSGGHINIGKANYGAGIKIVKVAYKANKDITRKEMR